MNFSPEQYWGCVCAPSLMAQLRLVFENIVWTYVAKCTEVAADFMILVISAVSPTATEEFKENEDDLNFDKISDSIVEVERGPRPGFARERVTRS